MAKKKQNIPAYGTAEINGVTYFRTRITDADGKRVPIYASTCEELYKKEQDARQQVQDILFRKQNPTVEDYCERWLLMRSATVTQDTLRNYRREMYKYIVEPLGNLYLSDVTADDIKLALVPVSKRAKHTFDTVNMLIKSVFYSAERSEVIDYNPAAKISAKGGVPGKPMDALTDEQVKKLVDAPNQAMMFSNQVIKHKKDFLHGMGLEEMEANITLDSPIPYSLDKMIDCLTALDQEMVPGARAGAEKKGPYNGQFTRFIQRLETKRKDKRLNFMFSREESLLKYDYMDELCCKLMLPAQNGKKGVKIIDFSEVPSDILPLIVSLIARVVFSVQQWSQVGERHPIAIFCDEAHLYMV